MPSGRVPYLKHSRLSGSIRKQASNGDQASQNLDSDDQNREPETGASNPLKGADGKTKFKPNQLHITWGDDRRYWSMPEEDGHPAELRQVCWLEVFSSMKAVKGKKYRVSFMLSMNQQCSFGWTGAPVSMMAKIGKKGKYQWKKINLSGLDGMPKEFPPDKYEVEFKTDDNTNDAKLYFGLYDVWSNNWKGGLQIHEAIVEEVTADDSASTSST